MAYNITRLNSQSTAKKVFFIASVIICLLIINNLAHSTYDLWKKQDLVAKSQKDLEREKAESRKLKARLTYVQNDAFIEEEARNKLFLVKPGESGVIVPKDLISSRGATPTPEPPNWKKWLEMIGIKR